MHQHDKPEVTDLVAVLHQAPEIATQLQTLLLALGHQSRQHLSEVDADLRQTNYLLDEAIATLGKSFMGIHAATSAQHALLAMLEEGAPVPPALLGKLAHLQQDASGFVRAAVTALQFQDMTNQLIGRALSHVASLDQVLQEAGQAAALLSAVACAEVEGYDDAGSDSTVRADHDRQALAVLVLVNRMLEEKSTIVGKVPGKAVAQTHLESGDIELF